MTNRAPLLACVLFSLAAVLAPVGLAHAAAHCEVEYVVDNEWNSGYVARLQVHNRSADFIDGWQLTWSMPAGQTIQHLWNGHHAQAGADVSVDNANYNGAIPPGGTVHVGYVGNHHGTNPVPSDFALNGIACGEDVVEPVDARFINLTEGEVVANPVTVKMAVSGFVVEPSGQVHHGAGHLHVLINTAFVPAGQVIPADVRHIHLGEGQLETVLDLSPGTHVLRLQLADGHHVALDGDEYRDEITVVVEEPGQCTVHYDIRHAWQTGFVADVEITNDGGRAIEGWTLDWRMPDGQRINHLWNGNVAQRGAEVSVEPASYNGQIPPGGTAAFGFTANHDGLNGRPAVFRLNGHACESPDGEQPASVRFVTPTNGERVDESFDVQMDVTGLVVEPAGESVPGAGHLHILIDTDFVPAGQTIPANATHLHYGQGQLDTRLTLAPGAHTLRLQFADGLHRALDGPQYRDEIQIVVEGEAPQPVSVRFVTPNDGEAVNGTFTVQMAATGLTVEPSGAARAGAGHFHILIDTDFVPAGQHIPADASHLHFGQGQQDATLTLTPGQHNLKLQFADGLHRALVGAEYRDAITVVVAGEIGGGDDEDPATGEDLYVMKTCNTCHGDDGLGAGNFPGLTGPFADRDELIDKIAQTMPLGDTDACDADCATLLADYILVAFATDTPPPEVAQCTGTPGPGPQVLRLLTRREYDATTSTLLGVTTPKSAAFPVEARALGYDNNVALNVVTASHIDAYLAAAEDLAKQAVAQSGPSLLTCDANDSSCAAQFIEQFGLRAYRRPLSPDEVERLLTLFATVDTFEQGVELTITAMLVSPHFLYRSEVGTAIGGGEFELTPYEVATSLSYLFWGTMPDAELFNAAANDRLRTTAELSAQADRLLADPRAQSQLALFASQWLGADPTKAGEKDPSRFPHYSEAVQTASSAELGAFINHVVYDGTGSFGELFNASYVFVNEALGDYYGLDGVSGDELRRIPLSDQSRGSVLSLASVLAAHAHSDDSSPVKRGVFVRERILCHELPPPPPTVDNTPPALDPDLTTRERFEVHSSSEFCQVCHQYIDGLGFGFQAYDGAGKHRLEENGVPVDDSGNVLGLDTYDPTDLQADLPNLEFAGLRELSEHIAASDAAPRCLTVQYFRHARGRKETASDSCAIDAMHQRFRDSGYRVLDLLTSIVTSPTFTKRRQPNEVNQ